MDDITTRTIIIAVNIFVTLTIVTVVILMFFQMQDIYKVVINTDNSINNSFDDIASMYSGKVQTGIGLLNTIKKYEEGLEDVEIIYPESQKIREYLAQREELANVGSTVKVTFREATCLKGLMENGKCYDKVMGILSTSFNYEDKYNVMVELAENGTTQIIFEKVNK